MNARLFCKTGALAGAEYQIGEEATIGWEEQNDITLPSDAVSDRHARIFFDDDADCYMLEDLDSSNGTYLDATEVVDPVPLKELHIITFAQEVDFIFQTVAEHAVSSSPEEEAKTQFGRAPEAPSALSGEDEAEGERTRFGEAPGALPDLPDEDPSEEHTEERSEGERIRFGEAPPETPDLSGESQEEAEEHTRFGESPPEVPDFFEEEESEADRTRYGDAPEELPDLSGEEGSSEKEEKRTEAEDRTRFGGSPPELPDFSEEDEGGDESDGERTQFEEAPGALPDLPEEESSSEQEEAPSEEEDRTRIGGAPDALPGLSEDESSSEEEKKSAEDEPPSEAPTQAVPLESSPRYALQVILETGPEGTHPLPEGEVTIGRSPDCDIQIDDPGVSRQHARLTVESGKVVVEDMGSKNFTFIDGERLSGPTALSPGAEIQFGLQAKAVLQRASA